MRGLLLILLVLLSARSWSQTFSVIHNFTGSDGGRPYGGLLLVNDTLYGTTYGGGQNGSGAIFKVKTNGTSYTVLKSFGPLVHRFGLDTNVDGAHPRARLVVSGNTIFGAAREGGSFGNGTIFKMHTNGTQFVVLKDFTNDANGIAVQGSAPYSGLTLAGNSLFWTDVELFKINIDGTGYSQITNLPSESELLLRGDTFYGQGGTEVFSIKTNGSNYTVIRTFTNSPDAFGQGPGLLLDGSTLYGTTGVGGDYGAGAVFRVDTNGSNYKVLKSFSFFDDATPSTSCLVLISNTLYGVNYQGGPSFYGTIFKINTDGTGYGVVRAFTSNDGLFPDGSLTSYGTTIYGTTLDSGPGGLGTLFSLDVTPIVATITRSNSFVGINWGVLSNHTYQLQLSANPGSSWTNVGNSFIATNSGTSTVVLPKTGDKGFYRINLVQ